MGRVATPLAEPPSVTGALDRMVDAAQGVVVDQIALARLEGVAALRHLLYGSGLIVAGAVLGVVAWVALLCAAHLLLREVVHPAASLAILGAVNVVAGAALVAVGQRALEGAGGEEGMHGAS